GSEQLAHGSPSRTTSPLPKRTAPEPLSISASPAGQTGRSGGGGASRIPITGFGGLGMGAQPVPGGSGTCGRAVAFLVMVPTFVQSCPLIVAGRSAGGAPLEAAASGRVSAWAAA